MQLHLAVENSVAAASDDLVDTSRGDGLAGAAAVAALRGGALAEVHAGASFVLAQGKLSWSCWRGVRLTSSHHRAWTPRSRT